MASSMQTSRHRQHRGCTAKPAVRQKEGGLRGSAYKPSKGTRCDFYVTRCWADSPGGSEPRGMTRSWQRAAAPTTRLSTSVSATIESCLPRIVSYGWMPVTRSGCYFLRTATSTDTPGSYARCSALPGSTLHLRDALSITHY